MSTAKPKESQSSASRRGPHSTFTQAIADTICARISEGFPLKTMCREPGMPAWRTVYDWIRDRPEFAAAMERARELGADAIAAECLEIADTPLEGEEVTIRGKTKEIKRGDMLGHRKLQIETRLKLLAKWHPQKYGERAAVEVTNPDGSLLVDETARAARVAQLIALAQARAKETDADADGKASGSA